MSPDPFYVANQARPPRAQTPTLTEVETFLEENGFHPLEPTRTDWIRPGDGTAISDVHPRQFVRGENGVVPVEAEIQVVPAFSNINGTVRFASDSQESEGELPNKDSGSDTPLNHDPLADRQSQSDISPENHELPNYKHGQGPDRIDGPFPETRRTRINLRRTTGHRRRSLRERGEEALRALREAVQNRFGRDGIRVFTPGGPEDTGHALTWIRPNGKIFIFVGVKKVSNLVARFRAYENIGELISNNLESTFEEEAIHTAEAIGYREEWENLGKPTDFDTFTEQRAAKILYELSSEISSLTKLSDPQARVLLRGIRSSSNLYRFGKPKIKSIDPSLFKSEIEELLAQNQHKQLANIVAEFVRQSIQLNRGGPITERTTFTEKQRTELFKISPEDFHAWESDVRAAYKLLLSLESDFPLRTQIEQTEKRLSDTDNI